MLGEWRRAARTLAAADLLVREGYPEDAVARAYYAILHAAKAALSLHDVIAESHSSVQWCVVAGDGAGNTCPVRSTAPLYATASLNTISQPWNTTARPVNRTAGYCRARRSSAR